jgi:mono/diheme cytochrome c family protein
MRAARALVLVLAVIGVAAGVKAQAPQGSAEPTFTPAQIARGDSIFRGKVAGGLCFTCHQLNAKGLPGLAPDLTDSKWLHGDGSYEFIVANIIKGVPKPKQASAPMLPRGGSSMTDADVRAVAAYVYSLSRPKK